MSQRALRRPGFWRRLARAGLLASSLVVSSAPLLGIGQNLDDGFHAGVSGSSATVYALAVQLDGKVILAGSFTAVNGVAHWNVARLNPDGSLDSTFLNGQVGGEIRAVAVQADGKIIVSGNFVNVGVAPYHYVARLNSNGTLDGTFADLNLDTFANALAVQTDGRVVLAGGFGSVGGQPYHPVARLNSDGTLDHTFTNPSADNVGVATALALQPDGKIIVGGTFSMFGGQSRHGVARMNSNGGLDNSFIDPQVLGQVYSVALQTDGTVVVGGNFSSVGGHAYGNLARLGADGSPDTTFANPNLDNLVSTVALRADGKILAGGNFGNHILFFNSDIGVDESVHASANGSVAAIAFQSDGKIVIGGDFTMASEQASNSIARLYPDGLADSDFSQDAFGVTGGQVSAVAVQADAKIIVGGGFTSAAGQTIGAIARAGVTGYLDRLYYPNPTAASDPAINSMALQPDGKLVVAGYFTAIGGETVNKIARLNSDGSADAGFDANQNPNDFISAMAVQADGKIVVGGPFTFIGGQTRNHIARLNADGTLDAAFNPNADSGIGAIAIQPDGKLVVAGAFSMIGGQTRNRIARLNPEGNLDPTFVDPGANGSVSTLVSQPDGKIVVGGFFTMIGGQAQCCIARLNANGSLDTAFTPNPDNYVEALALQTDGKIVIGGMFNHVSGQYRGFLARLNSDGSLDMNFVADANNSVLALALQFDGKLVVGGLFTTLGGKTRGEIARLGEPEPTLQSFDVIGYTGSGSAVTWSRSGDGPEFCSAPLLSMSTDGQTYFVVGPMQRVSGGWRHSGLVLPPLNQNFYLRVTGLSASGSLDGSGGVIENISRFYLTSDDGIFAGGFD